MKIKILDPVRPKNIKINIYKAVFVFEETESPPEIKFFDGSALPTLFEFIRALEDMKSRLSTDWNKHCNLGAYGFAEIVLDNSYKILCEDDLAEIIPIHEDYRDIAGRYSTCKITFFDEFGIEHNCELIK